MSKARGMLLSAVAALALAGAVSVGTQSAEAAQYEAPGVMPEPGVAADNCWVIDIGRKYQWHGDHYQWDPAYDGVARLQACWYGDATQIWAKARIIGPAWSKMAGIVRVGIHEYGQSGPIYGLHQIQFNDDTDAHYDHGVQAYGGTYFTNSWTTKITRVPGHTIAVYVWTSGRVSMYNAHTEADMRGLSDAGLSIAGSPNTRWGDGTGFRV